MMLGTTISYGNQQKKCPHGRLRKIHKELLNNSKLTEVIKTRFSRAGACSLSLLLHIVTETRQIDFVRILSHDDGFEVVPFIYIPTPNVKYLAMHRVHMHAGAILYSLELVDYLLVHTHKPYTNFCFMSVKL